MRASPRGKGGGVENQECRDAKTAKAVEVGLYVPLCVSLGSRLTC